MFPSDHPSGQAASLKLADDIAMAASFGDLEGLRREFLAMTGLNAEERSGLENALATRERELIEFYTCRL
jgi:hypothetical protein